MAYVIDWNRFNIIFCCSFLVFMMCALTEYVYSLNTRTHIHIRPEQKAYTSLIMAKTYCSSFMALIKKKAFWVTQSVYHDRPNGPTHLIPSSNVWPMNFSSFLFCYDILKVLGRGFIRDIHHISGFISTKAHVPPLATGKCSSIIHCLYDTRCEWIASTKKPSNRHLTNSNCATTNIAHTIWKTFQFLLKRSICCPLLPCVSEAFMGFRRFQNTKENV